MWEALEHAAHFELDNLVAIIDVNRLGQRGETMHGWNLDAYADRARAFGWHAIEIDGHDVEAIDARATPRRPTSTGQPVVIVAKTIKGKGVAAVEDKNGWHGKPLDDADAAIAELGGVAQPRRSRSRSPTPRRRAHAFPSRRRSSCRATSSATEVATRKAYGDALAALGAARGDVVALDGEVSNSTFAEEFATRIPERFFEMYIAEQQMVAAAVGMQVLGWRPFASTFAAFLSRAYDFIRMAAISRANYCLCGSHAGVSIGEDGPSQMALEDIAIDARRPRLDRALPVRREPDREARRGDGRPRRDRLPAHAAAGDAGPLRRPTRSSRSAAARSLRRAATTSRSSARGSPCTRRSRPPETLAGEGIAARVIDLYSIKPLDADDAALRCDVSDRHGVEDHWAEGGLGEAVLSALGDADERPRGRPARGARDAALGQAGGAARRGRDRRRRRSPPQRGRPGAGSRERVVELLLLLASGAVRVGAVGARLDDLGDRRVRDLVPGAFEREHGRAAE